MVVSMTIHPRYQYKPEELFQTDSTGHCIRLHRRLAQTLSGSTTKAGVPRWGYGLFGSAICPESELQRTPYYWSGR